MGKISTDELTEYVKKAINPKFKTWVLFSHGTYVIIDDTTIIDKKKFALKQIKEFGPVFPGCSAGDIGVSKLHLVEGWSVSGHGYGIYTYVHPTEMESKNPSDIDIGFYGRNKRDQDSKDTSIIFVSE
ncbi:MAG TPA: hypothetical protein VK766_10430 [Cytophagaceae bacterium]|nr:hypothetical protein [Cytophagaceae bacterium]